MESLNIRETDINKFETEESETAYYELLAKRLGNQTAESDAPPWVFSMAIGRRFVVPRGIAPVNDGALKSMIEEYNSLNFTTTEQFMAELHKQCVFTCPMPSMFEVFSPDLSILHKQNIRLENYNGEHQLPGIMQLVSRDLSEPYSIYTYRYFVCNWPSLCFIAFANDSQECIGAILCKMSVQRNGIKQGYIAMLAVDRAYRRRKVARNLVLSSLSAMLKDGCDEVTLETETLAAACIYLACKLEEDCRRCGRIVSVCYEILHPNGPTLTRGEFYDSLKKSVFLLEHHVIRQLGFRLQVKHPHDYLLHYLRSMIGWLTPSHVRISRLPKVAVTLLQDCYLHPVLIDDHPPQYIASAVLYVALSFCRIRVNCTTAENYRAWWQIFCPSLTDDELLAVSHKILNIYESQ